MLIDMNGKVLKSFWEKEPKEVSMGRGPKRSFVGKVADRVQKKMMKGKKFVSEKKGGKVVNKVVNKVKKK